MMKAAWMRATWVAPYAALALCGCAGSGEGLDENGRPIDEQVGGGALEPTFVSIQQHVFIPTCAQCHSGAAAPLGLRLDEADAYAALVNAPSVEAPAILRVQPGDADASWLVQKLEGTASVGARMPLDAPPLPAATIAVIRQWITDGAVLGEQTPSNASAPARISAANVTPGESLTSPPREIVLSSQSELVVALFQADVVSLRASGGDGGFGEGNEHDVPIRNQVRMESPTILAVHVDAPPLTADVYELRVSGEQPLALTDAADRAIDGDGDGEPGGDFVLRFSVEPSP
jgi:hypothetical protein